MRALVAFVAFAVVAAVAPCAARAGAPETSIRCAGGIVSVGDATVDLLGKCGAPALREGGQQVTTVAYGTDAGPVRRATAVTAERWSYDFGPQAFLMFVTVDGGKVTAIERGGYGYATPAAPPAPAPAIRRARCDPGAIREGLSKLDLLARCGEPTVTERKDDVLRLTVVARGGVITSETPVVSEVWTYDFGPQRFVRFAFLEDGVVVRVETGGHGFSR